MVAIIHVREAVPTPKSLALVLGKLGVIDHEWGTFIRLITRFSGKRGIRRPGLSGGENTVG